MDIRKYFDVVGRIFNEIKSCRIFPGQCFMSRVGVGLGSGLGF